MAMEDAEQRFEELAKRLWATLGEDGPGALAIAASSLRIADLAQVLEYLDREQELAGVFSALPIALAAEVLEEAHHETRDFLLENTADARMRDILAEADADDAVYFLDHLDDERAQNLLSSLDEGLREQLAEQWDLDEDSAGRIMQREVSTVRPFHTREQAIERLKSWTPCPKATFSSSTPKVNCWAPCPTAC